MKPIIRKTGKTLILKGLVLLAFAILSYPLVRSAEMYRKYRPMIDALEKIRRHEYTDSYKCLDFSKDLYAELEKEGVKSKIEIVQKGGVEDEYHAVVSFQVDPQSGKLVDYKNVDTCEYIEGEMVCQRGLIADKDKYITIAGR